MYKKIFLILPLRDGSSATIHRYRIDFAFKSAS